MKSIGEIYFDSSFFNDEASKTIGQPIIGEQAMQILANRRTARGRLNEAGNAILKNIVNSVKEVFPDTEVKTMWDRHCGCSMCPCSPGYRIKIDREFRSKDETRFNIYIDEKGKVDFRAPKFIYEIGERQVKKLENTFKDE